MAAVMGSAELLANHFDRLAPEKRDELFNRINGSLRRMTEMLDDVLTLNRLDGRRTTANPVAFDLRRHLADVLEEVRLGDRDGHVFVLAASEEAVPLFSDPVLLHPILSNLLSNAARYSPAGRTITLRLDVAPERVRIAVEDEGIGIPAEDRARIFEPFERGSNVGHIKGTGLGLNIVQRMTDLLGGRIEVDGRAGGGSVFTVDLPRTPAPTPP
jgi:signal transduction histidine kinase